MVSSLGTGAFGWPASVLNLFWYALAVYLPTADLWQSKAGCML